jgi:hypothetical protein
LLCGGKRKAMFPSVACHPDNFLEVCFWGNSCHQNIHNGTITWELLADSAEWKIIVDKFKKIFPFIAESERKNIPEHTFKRNTMKLTKLQRHTAYIILLG